jgi:hypothetical protein
MASVYPIVAIRVNETSWTHVWRLRSHYLRTEYDNLTCFVFVYMMRIYEDSACR